MMEPRPLTIKNQFMFNKVMLNEEICTGFIERVLDIHVTKIEYLNKEQVIEPTLDLKGVRLDVYVETDQGVFDIEMQSFPKQDLDYRLAFYQAAIDSRRLEKGDDFDELCDSAIVFLCDFDPYGLGDAIYIFERVCTDNPEAKLERRSPWVVLNAKAADVAPTKELAALLEYVATGIIAPRDEFVSQIDQSVQEANRDMEWREMAWSVSTVWEDAQREVRIAKRAGLKEGRAEGRAEGEARAEKRYSQLINGLLNANRLDDLKAACDNPDVREELYQEFGL